MTDLERFLSHVCKTDSCWIWTGAVGNNGYGGFGFRGSMNARSHRVSWILFRGEIPDKIKVLHKCDVRRCVNPDHLFLGSTADNAADMVRKGRSRLRDNKEGISLEKSDTIKRDARNYTKISEEYGVSIALISLIKNDKIKARR
jgi:hypothetical protein